MKNFPDSLIIEMFKNLDIKSAIRLGGTSKRHHSILNNPEYGLWEFYLNRDFPQAAQPLDKDFKSTYIRHYLRGAVNRLMDVVDFILDPEKIFRCGFNNLRELRTLKTKVSDLTDLSTVQELTHLQLQLKTAVGANNIYTSSNRTPLHYALLLSNARIALALIDAGANVNADDNEGETALMFAAWVNDATIIQALIQAGANVNAANKYGITPLFWAACVGFTENAKALIQAGADINAVTFNNETPLRTAKIHKHTNTTHLIEGVIHFKSTVKPMLISKALKFQERHNSLEQNGNKTQNGMPNLI